ncbi:uncharacterized protein N7459_004712 [Penicillium hispanicum]|uniref:uncharacterized protein n=1 Tax=Penicillium hispanicum TaxID=1080232 RepID=UPI0025410572|nr:uncharacterized protein N7459_004712 [Penicillium hispanicum]KAJ5584912.1 hypothetical protein N7459_004712 [Penicillium hispanicum]
MAPVEPPQLRFLSKAADWLDSRSPSTSAHLLAVHTRILLEDQKPLHPRQHKHHCGGCGSLRQGKSSVTRVSPKNSRSHAVSKPGSIGGATVYKCQRCKQRVVLPRMTSSKPLRASKPPAPVKTVTATSSTPTAASTANSIPSETAALTADPAKNDNVNSKKRAKARKQGGLAALLASKRSEQPSLDLLDFLQ